MWSRKSNQKQIEYDLRLSHPTVVKLCQFMRSVCEAKILHDHRNRKIGGEGLIVEIDETKLFVRKYHRGRLTKKSEWAFGGKCRQTKQFFVRFVRYRNRETLEAILLENVLLGTTIFSDKWAAYRRLQEIGFNHGTVNHSQHFVDPDTGVNTNLVENMWRWLKADMPTVSVPEKFIQGYLFQYQWRLQYGGDGAFENILHHIEQHTRNELQL